MTSLPPKRCGFSSATTSTVRPSSRSTSSSTTVVVPTSIGDAVDPVAHRLERRLAVVDDAVDDADDGIDRPSGVRRRRRRRCAAGGARPRSRPRPRVRRRPPGRPAGTARAGTPRRGVGGDRCSAPSMHLDDALAAAPAGPARGRHPQPRRLRVVEERPRHRSPARAGPLSWSPTRCDSRSCRRRRRSAARPCRRLALVAAAELRRAAGRGRFLYGQRRVDSSSTVSCIEPSRSRSMRSRRCCYAAGSIGSDTGAGSDAGRLASVDAGHGVLAVAVGAHVVGELLRHRARRRP